MATDHLLIAFDLTDFRENTRALLYKKHGGDTRDAVQELSEIFDHLSHKVDEVYSDVDAFDKIIEAIYLEYDGLYCDSKEDFNSNDEFAFTRKYAEKFGWKITDEYGLFVTDDAAIFSNYYESMFDNPWTVCSGMICLNKNSYSYCSGHFFNPWSYNEEEWMNYRDNYKDIEALPFGKYLMNADVYVFSNKRKANKDDYTEEEWKVHFSHLSGDDNDLEEFAKFAKEVSNYSKNAYFVDQDEEKWVFKFMEG